MSVILIRPRNKSIPQGIVSTQYPINIGYLASWLESNGISVKLFDYEVEDIKEDFLVNVIKDIKPALIGISCMTSNIKAGHDIASGIKKYFPELKVVIGGVHSTAIPGETLKEFPCFDIVIRGEGEKTLLDLYRALISGTGLSAVKGLVYRGKNNSFIDTGIQPLISDLDALPFPDRELLKIDRYKRTHTSRGFSRISKNIAEIMTARGCPFSCIFCASNVTFGRQVRYRSVKNIITEIEECIDKYSVNHFSILDDTFTFRKDILYPVCDYLKSKKVTWDCFTRVDRVTEEMVKKVVESGCEKISFGIESGSPRILSLIGKAIGTDQIREVFRLCRKSGLRYVEATFMLGNHPLESWEDIRTTTDLIMDLDPDFIAFSLTAPFPGTELNRMMKEKGYLGKENWDEFVLYGSKPGWKYEYLNVDDLIRFQKDFLKKFYLRPAYVFRQLARLRSFKEFLYWARIAMDMVKST